MMKRLKFFTLAALLVLPLAACDEGEEVAGPVSGSVQGTVTIDGEAASGVTVTLSTGATTTTDASGQYTFSDVAQGAHTVTISGFPADATFPSTTQAAVIATGGQAVTVNFAGSSIRTSAIVGTVSSGGQTLEGVTVTLSGAGSGSTTTDANGDYSFSGIGAGSYTVTISGLPDGVSCAQTSRTATVEAGETEDLDFTCNPSGAGVISGQLYVDGNENDVRDSGEQTLQAGDVTITLEGPTIGETRSTVTNEDGTYSFTDLVSGSYTACIDEDDEDIPDNVEYGGATECFTRTLSGGGATVDFPFDITAQAVQVGAFLGEDDEETAGTAPVPGVIIELYATHQGVVDLDQDALLGRDTTDADGFATFDFDRADDFSPAGPDTDNIVFARYVSAPPNLFLNGESRIEIRYDPSTIMGTADDEFDLLSSQVRLGAQGLRTGSGEPLEDWTMALWQNDTAATVESQATDDEGRVVFTRNVSPGNLPDTFYIRLSQTQAQAFGHQFTQTPVPEEGTARNRYLRYIFNGLALPTDTVEVGDEVVKFQTADLLVRVYHERDDTAWMTMGDDFVGATTILVDLLRNGQVVETKRPQATDGAVTFTNLPVDSTYQVRARAETTRQTVITDTLIDVQELDGRRVAVYECPLGADAFGTAASCATFAQKFNDGTVIVNVTARDSVQDASGVRYRIEALPRTLSPKPADTTDVVDTTFTSGFTTAADTVGLTTAIREGVYTVSVIDSVNATTGDTVWTVAPDHNRVDTIDINQPADTAEVHFVMIRGDTEIQGLVVNDRDNDQNTIDVGEAPPAGVEMRLYRDNAGAPVVSEDSLVATTATNAQGEYEFTGLREGRYIVKAGTSENLTVLRNYTTAGLVVDTAVVKTAARSTATFADSSRVVGTDATPIVPPLPRWDYDQSTCENCDRTDFTFLYTNGIVQGEVEDADGDPVASRSIVLTRCYTAPVEPEQPVMNQACSQDFPGWPVLTTQTDASGMYSFSDLEEGIYEVEIAGGGTPTRWLVMIDMDQDIETANFTTP